MLCVQDLIACFVCYQVENPTSDLVQLLIQRVNVETSVHMHAFRSMLGLPAGHLD